MEFRGEHHTLAAEVGMAVVFALMALRLVLRIREDGRVTEDLVRSEEDFRGLIESSSDGIAIMDAEFRLLFTSPAARDLLGLAVGATDDAEVSLLDLRRRRGPRAGPLATLEHPAGDGPPLHFRVRRPTAAPRELEVTSTERPGSGRRVLYLRDVTNRRRRERELERMAYTDHLTALPNRATLFQEMAARPRTSERCLLVLDLDGFKAVNDVAGHESGDQLLVEVARRLHTVVREDDLVARLGGDEFAVLVAGSIDDAEEVAERVVDVLGMPHRAGEWAFAVGASVGVAALGAGRWAGRLPRGRRRAARGQAGGQGLRAAGRTRGRVATRVPSRPRAPRRRGRGAAAARRRLRRPTAGSCWCTPSRSGSTPCTAPSAARSCGPPPSGRAARPRCSAGCWTRRAWRSPGWPTTASASPSACPPGT